MDGDEAETPSETSLANNDVEAGTDFHVAATVPVETLGDALHGIPIFGGDDDELFVLGGNEREKSEDDSEKIHAASVAARNRKDWRQGRVYSWVQLRQNSSLREIRRTLAILSVLTSASEYTSGGAEALGENKYWKGDMLQALWKVGAEDEAKAPTAHRPAQSEVTPWMTVFVNPVDPFFIAVGIDQGNFSVGHHRYSHAALFVLSGECSSIYFAMMRSRSVFDIGCHPCGFIGLPYTNEASAAGFCSFSSCSCIP